MQNLQEPCFVEFRVVTKLLGCRGQIEIRCEENSLSTEGITTLSNEEYDAKRMSIGQINSP